MTGGELDRLELGDRPADAMLFEDVPRWAPHMLTAAADYVSTLAIYAAHGGIRLERPNPPAHYQRRYLLDGTTRTWRTP